MKQFSIVVIVLSAILSISTHLIHQIHLYFGFFDMLYPAITIYIRFGELTLLLGFIGLFITTKQKQIKLLTFSIIILGFVHFFLIEFGMILIQDHVSNILHLSKIVAITLLVLHFKTYDLGLFMAKGYFLIGIVVLYTAAYIFLFFFDQPVVDDTQTSLTGTILTAFFILFKFGIFNFFREWYIEAFTYNNKDLIDL